METALTRLLNEKLQEKFDGNASELARVVGTSQQNISNWMNGDVLKPAYWRQAAIALGISEPVMLNFFRKLRGEYTALKGGASPNDVYFKPGTLGELEAHSIPLPTPAKPPAIHPGAIVPPNATIAPRQPIVTTNKMLPVLGMAVGGEDGKYIFNGSIIDYVACPPSLEYVTGAYAVYIDGESMYPRFKAGETVWVHPGKTARRGDDVIVQIKPTDDDGSPPWGYVKEYVGRQGNQLVLRQYNPAIEIKFDVDEVLTTHPIVLAGKY
jgi:SOS-response transcriptional repressor LexA